MTGRAIIHSVINEKYFFFSECQLMRSRVGVRQPVKHCSNIVTKWGEKGQKNYWGQIRSGIYCNPIIFILGIFSLPISRLVFDHFVFCKRKKNGFLESLKKSKQTVQKYILQNRRRKTKLH